MRDNQKLLAKREALLNQLCVWLGSDTRHSVLYELIEVERELIISEDL